MNMQKLSDKHTLSGFLLILICYVILLIKIRVTI